MASPASRCESPCRPCPHCAEPILPAAVRCRFCQQPVAAADPSRVVVPGTPLWSQRGPRLLLALGAALLLWWLGRDWSQPAPSTDPLDGSSASAGWSGFSVTSPAAVPIEACTLTVNGKFRTRGTMRVEPGQNSYEWFAFADGDGARFNFSARAVRRLTIDCDGPVRAYQSFSWD